MEEHRSQGVGLPVQPRCDGVPLENLTEIGGVVIEREDTTDLRAERILPAVAAGFDADGIPVVADRDPGVTREGIEREAQAHRTVGGVGQRLRRGPSRDEARRRRQGERTARLDLEGDGHDFGDLARPGETNCFKPIRRWRSSTAAGG